MTVPAALAVERLALSDIRLSDHLGRRCIPRRAQRLFQLAMEGGPPGGVVDRRWGLHAGDEHEWQ